MATRTDRRERADADTGRPMPDTAPDEEVGVTDLESRHFLSILKRAVKAVSYTHLTLPTNREV